MFLLFLLCFFNWPEGHFREENKNEIIPEQRATKSLEVPLSDKKKNQL